mmetsp:Transcript_37763/g.61190  ORF Transcript_37763/g.61190 Transcript_37763/m.61190 type:complete len:130 (-) Transcript_37763:177-566(-)
MLLLSPCVHNVRQAFSAELERDAIVGQKPAFVPVLFKGPIHCVVKMDATPTRAALGGAFRCSTTTDASVIMDMNSAKHWVYVSISTSAPGTEIFAKVVPVSTMLELSRVGVPKALFLIHLGPPVEFLLT